MPAPTGKFIIWPAKTKVATRPAIGAVRSSSSRRAPRRATAIRGRGDDAGRHRGRGVEEAVGHVHVCSGSAWDCLDVWWPTRIPRYRVGTHDLIANCFATTTPDRTPRPRSPP